MQLKIYKKILVKVYNNTDWQMIHLKNENKQNIHFYAKKGKKKMTSGRNYKRWRLY